MVGGSVVVVAGGSDEDVGGEKPVVLGAGREVLLVLLGVLSSGGFPLG